MSTAGLVLTLCKGELSDPWSVPLSVAAAQGMGTVLLLLLLWDPAGRGGQGAGTIWGWAKKQRAH